jgi:hypothetical protein
VCVFGRRRRIIKVLFMRKKSANKNHEGKLCVASNYNRVHGRISMKKPMDS